jgi:FKBP-type peptidyl-prolyl cis-trans isomerase
MKRSILALCLLLSALGLHARGIQEEYELADEKVRTSFAFGMVLGADLQSSGLDFDYAAFTEGLKAAMQKQQTEMTQEEALEIAQAALDASMVQRSEENRAEEARYLAENGARPGVQSTPSGLQYEVLTEGTGEKPPRTDTVRVYYEGTLTNGSVFDGTEQNEPVAFPLDRVIPGWTEGIQLMSVGSSYRLYIPSSLAYGAQGAGPVIPPYSTLIFTVELLEIVRETEAEEETEE